MKCIIAILVIFILTIPISLEWGIDIASFIFMILLGAWALVDFINEH